MDVASLVEVEDLVITDQGDSLIERIFADGFYVVADDGRLLTTPNNADLLDQAIALVEEAGDADAQEIAEELREIVSQADSLSQEDYEEAWAREAERSGDEDYDDDFDKDDDKEKEEKDWDE